MARPAFAGRRARSRAGQLAAFGAVVLLVSAALAVIGGAILPVLDAGSRQIVAQSGPTAAAERIQTRLADDAEQQDATVRAAIGTALRDLPAEVVRTLSVDTDAVLDGQPVRVQFTADPKLPAAAELTSGTWPASADQVAVPDAAAARLGLAVGDELTLAGQTLRVSATWRATDPAAPRWFSDPAVASGAEETAIGPVLVDESRIIDLDDTPSARWTILPDPTSLGVAGLPAWADAMARLDAEVRRINGNDGVSLIGTFPDSVARATRVTSVAGGILGLPLVLVVVAGAIVLALIGRALAASRGGEFVLLRARGAAPGALAIAAAREALLVALLAALAGAAAAYAILRATLPALGATADPPLALVAGMPALTVLLAVILATTATVTELRAPVTGRAESGRAAVVASLGPLLLVAVAAGLALAQFLSLGGPVLVRADGVVRTDPVALTAPVLVLLAGALAAPVIAGPVVGVAERIARLGRGILPVLPLRQLARRTRSVAAGVLVLALATGSVVLALGFQLGATQTRLAAERASTGDDVRVSLPVRTSVEKDAPAASSATVADVAGVDHALAVLATTASIGADAIPLVAGDPALLAEVRSAPPQLAGLAPGLTASRAGSELPPGADELTVTLDLAPNALVPPGLTLDVVLWLTDGDGAALRVPLDSVPLAEGTAEATGAIPPTATSLVAVEVRPPGLPPQSIVDIDLARVATSQGDAVALAGETSSTLTSSKAERFLAEQPSDDPLPVVVGAEFASRFGVAVGDGFTFRVATVSTQLSATVTGVVPSVPGESGSLGFVLDLQTLESRAVSLGGSVPAANQLWLSTTVPDAAVAAVRDVATVRAGYVAPRTFSAGPVLDPTVALVVVGVAVTVVLAALGFAAVATSIAERRRTELTPLRSLGLTVGRIRSARIIELAVTAVLAVLLGAAAGALTALVVVPGLTGVLG